MSLDREIEFRVLDPRLGTEFPLPGYATAASAGLDLRALPPGPLEIAPGASELVPTGIAIHLNDPGLCAMVLPRSGLGHRQGLVLGNLVGLIDADYQGPLMLSLWNRSNQLRVVQPGDRVAQLVVVPVARVALRQVESFAPSPRGEGGFGHTGLR